MTRVSPRILAEMVMASLQARVRSGSRRMRDRSRGMSLARAVDRRADELARFRSYPRQQSEITRIAPPVISGRGER